MLVSRFILPSALRSMLAAGSPRPNSRQHSTMMEALRYCLALTYQEWFYTVPVFGALAGECGSISGECGWKPCLVCWAAWCHASCYNPNNLLSPSREIFTIFKEFSLTKIRTAAEVVYNLGLNYIRLVMPHFIYNADNYDSYLSYDTKEMVK